jgi:hypothetical protein
MNGVGATPFSLTSISGSTIFNGIWNLVLGLMISLEGDISLLFQQSFGGFGASVVDMFNSFGGSLGAYGVWAPVMFVVGLGLALLIGFLLFDVIDAEKDVTGFENDV